MNSAQQSAASHIDALIEQAYAEITKLVESEARRILRARNPARSFCMGMGTCSFYDKDGMPMYDDHPALKSFYEFVYEYNGRLCFTGIPMKIDGPDEPTLTDW